MREDLGFVLGCNRYCSSALYCNSSVLYCSIQEDESVVFVAEIDWRCSLAMFRQLELVLKLGWRGRR